MVSSANEFVVVDKIKKAEIVNSKEIPVFLMVPPLIICFYIYYRQQKEKHKQFAATYKISNEELELEYQSNNPRQQRSRGLNNILI
jgi:predicted histidine transporter YuiF (NhaC family)